MKRSAANPLIILVDESEAATVFDSVESAEAHMEAIDVEDGIYSVYDSVGRELLVRALPDGNARIGDGTGRVDAQAARAALTRTAEWVGLEKVRLSEEDLTALPLPDLAARIREHDRTMTWLSRVRRRIPFLVP